MFLYLFWQTVHAWLAKFKTFLATKSFGDQMYLNISTDRPEDHPKLQILRHKLHCRDINKAGTRNSDTITIISYCTLHR